MTYESDRAAAQMKKQGDIVLAAMPLKSICDVEWIVDKINEKGHDWSESHVLGTLKYLKGLELVTQRQGNRWERTK